MKILLASLLVAVAMPASQAGTLSWKEQNDSVALLDGGQILWRFNFGTAEGKPNFHPVALPGGPVITASRPADHPWHLGLWFSWKFINGVNYWEQDKKTGLSEGRTEWQKPVIVLKPDFSAEIAIDLSYRPTNGSTVLTEHRVISVSAPDATGRYAFDWTQTFTAATKVLLDRTPLPDEPGGKPYGGYAGLSVRLNTGMKDIQGLADTAPVEFKASRYRGKAGAFDYTGVLEGRELGVAIIDHPANLNSPSPWYAINEPVMHYFSPAVICYKPHALQAGASLPLRYRVVIHPGRFKGEALQAEAAGFR